MYWGGNGWLNVNLSCMSWRLQNCSILIPHEWGNLVNQTTTVYVYGWDYTRLRTCFDRRIWGVVWLRARARTCCWIKRDGNWCFDYCNSERSELGLYPWPAEIVLKPSRHVKGPISVSQRTVGSSLIAITLLDFTLTNYGGSDVESDSICIDHIIHFHQCSYCNRWVHLLDLGKCVSYKVVSQLYYNLAMFVILP